MSQFYRDEPWGPWRDNAHAGLIAATIANAFSGKDARPASFEDFIFMNAEAHAERTRERQARSRRMLLATLRAIAGKDDG